MDFISASVMLFLIMDPVGNLPFFHAILGNTGQAKRVRIMARELVIAYVILCVFLFGGHQFLGLLGLKQSTLGIAGGTILFLVALRMVFPAHGIEPESEISDPFIVPLAAPLIAGPAAMAMLLLLVSKHPDRLLVWLGSLTTAWVACAAIILASNLFMRLLGDRGVRAMTKLMGMLLIMIASQMFLDGLKSFLELNS